MSASPSPAGESGLHPHVATQEVLKLLSVIVVDSLIICSTGEKHPTGMASGAAAASSSKSSSLDVMDLVLEVRYKSSGVFCCSYWCCVQERPDFPCLCRGRFLVFIAIFFPGARLCRDILSLESTELFLQFLGMQLDMSPISERIKAFRIL